MSGKNYKNRLRYIKSHGVNTKTNLFETQYSTSGRGSSEKVGRWTNAEGRGLGRVRGSGGVTPGKFLKI